MGLNRRMGEKLRDRQRIRSEDDEKKASGQSKVLPKIPEQRTGLAVELGARLKRTARAGNGWFRAAAAAGVRS